MFCKFLTCRPAVQQYARLVLITDPQELQRVKSYPTLARFSLGTSSTNP